ncbi:MAG TPA: hypothetical protein VFR37_03685 [Longimicrobium sp.]|nr:hypothetical protein [Longimicrobium sp.]
MMRKVLWTVGAALLLGSCDDDPTRHDDLTTVVVDNATSFFAVEASDARTGLPLDGVQVTLGISGPAARRVIDVAGNPITELTTDRGFMALGLTGAVPTKAAPAELLVVASAAGYVETSQWMTHTAARNDPEIIAMVSLAAPPPGTAVGTSGAAVAGPGGVLAATVTVSTAPDAVTGGRASVTLPAGTVVRDRSGTPLSGALQTTVVYFNNQNDESLAAFPGGFSPRVENPPAGSPSGGAFTSAGFASITVRDGAGREARTFSTPIQVSVDVPAATVNPETGAAVKNGDVVPYWSYATRTGRWRYEGLATLAGPNAAGNFTTAVPTNHLSPFNDDWWIPPCSSAPIYIIGGSRGMNWRLTLKRPGAFLQVNIRDSVLDVGTWAPRTPFESANRVHIVATDLVTGRVGGTLETSQLCRDRNELKVARWPVARLAIEVRVICGELLLRPWGWMRFRGRNASRWLWGVSLVDGIALLGGLEPNTQYELENFGVYQRGLQSGTVSATTGEAESERRVEIEYEIPEEACLGIGGHDQGGGP